MPNTRFDLFCYTLRSTAKPLNNKGEIMKFDEIIFGKATGEQEGAYIPELLRDGFIDKGNVLKKLRDEDKFLVLGYKGSGKSTIAEKIRLESHPEDNDSKYVAKI